MNLLEVEQNKVGHDYVVGDIHGCFLLLNDLLGQIDFDPKVDRLFSVGDLVDRGPESKECLDWLKEPWFYAVRGNHEQLAIEWYEGGPNPYYDLNGGQWFIALDQEQQEDYVRAFRKLPLAIEIPFDDGRAGLVHAEVPSDDWALFKQLLDERDLIDHFEHYAMWGRDIIRKHRLGIEQKGVANIDVVYVGHSVVPEVTEVGNIRYVDTGAVFGKKLTVMNMHTGQVYEGRSSE